MKATKQEVDDGDCGEEEEGSNSTLTDIITTATTTTYNKYRVFRDLNGIQTKSHAAIYWEEEDCDCCWGVEKNPRGQ